MGIDLMSLAGRRLWAAAGAAVLVVAVLAAAAWTVLGARADLLAGRAALERAQAALADEDIDAGGEQLTAARADFARGEARLTSVLAWPARIVPGVGRNVEAAGTMAAAGRLATEAGIGVTAELATLEGGLQAFAPRDGRIPLEPVAAMAEPLAGAAERLDRADALAADVPRSWLVPQLSDARDEMTAELTVTREVVEAAAAVAQHLPGFLGADGQRRYLIGAQNPSELRGTGGLIGAIGELTVDDGEVDVSEFRSIGELTRNAPDDLEAPSDDFEARYGRYGAVYHGSNINMTPDMPTAATALETLYAAVEDDAVDGTILADPRFFQALLEVTGPVEVDGVGRVDADMIIEFATRDQYAELEDPGEGADRKELLGDVAEEALRAFMAGADDPRQALTSLTDAARDGRLLLHSTDDDEQAAFVVAGVDGSLADPDGDYLSVVGNNGAGNKGDTFYERDILHNVQLQRDGSAEVTLTMTLVNNAPTEGYHRTVLGHRLDNPGDNRTIWSVYCAPGCDVRSFQRDGEDTPVSLERELDRPVASATTVLPSGEETELQWSWVVPDAWAVDGDGRYELLIDGQPHLMNSETSVRVHPPPGYLLQPLPASELEVPTHGAAAYDGEPGNRVRLAAEVTPSVRRSVTGWTRHVLNRPLIELLAG